MEKRTISYSGCNSDTLFNFLGLKDNPGDIYRSINNSITKYNHGSEDSFFNEMYELSKGIRILRQDPWECLISFICSQNSNVQAIGKRIILLMKNYGPICSNDENLFPNAGILSESTQDDLRKCQTGYRAPYLKGTAEYIKNNSDFFDQVFILQYQEAKNALMKLPGVGPKVADCVLLFGFERMEAVPVDIRIRRIITQQYADKLPTHYAASEYSYNTISDFCRNYFGPYAGYAQQYLFATRDI